MKAAVDRASSPESGRPGLVGAGAGAGADVDVGLDVGVGVGVPGPSAIGAVAIRAMLKRSHQCEGKPAAGRPRRVLRAPRIPEEASPRGYFLSERMGLVATGRGFTAAWAVPEVPGRAAVHASTS